MKKRITTLTIKDSLGEVHEFKAAGLDFYHDDAICRVYIRDEKITIASFTNPVSVLKAREEAS